MKFKVALSKIALSELYARKTRMPQGTRTPAPMASVMAANQRSRPGGENESATQAAATMTKPNVAAEA